jgi:type IV pilus assembly protein PilC
MKRYKYKAKNDKGELVQGEVEAANDIQAAKLIRQQNLVVISISPKRELPLNLAKKFSGGIGMGELTKLTRQLATMINAGLPITEALLILRSQSKGAAQRTISQILADVENGKALSMAMHRYPNVFSKTYIALIKSGEAGGVLDEVLLKLADDMEKQQEFRGKVKGALIYPAVIIVGMVVVALIMFIFVIPRLTTMYDQFDAELPITTKVLIAVSNFLIKFWPVVILAAGVGAYGFKLFRNTESGRRRMDEFLLKIPVIGNLQRQIVLAEVTRTLSLMVSSGVSILEGLRISSEVVNNKVTAQALAEATKMVEKGFPLAFAFSRHSEAFPLILSQMIAVGEETGKMDEVLSKVSHVFEIESEQKIKALTASIEPAILIVLGVGVAFLVISIIMPIYNLTTQF